MTGTEQRILDELSISLQNGKVYSDIELAVQSEAIVDALRARFPVWETHHCGPANGYYFAVNRQRETDTLVSTPKGTNHGNPSS